MKTFWTVILNWVSRLLYFPVLKGPANIYGLIYMFYLHYVTMSFLFYLLLLCSVKILCSTLGILCF